MKILITAGSTSERIDSVRKITNAATGRLGSLIADTFDRRAEGNLEKIFFICERGSMIPQTARAEIVTVQGVGQLEASVRDLMNREKIDAVVHSMAVSDYMVDRVSTAEMLSSVIARRISDTFRKDIPDLEQLEETILSSLINDNYGLDMSRKVSSEIDRLQVHLKKTPKIIGLFKQLQTESVVVGFKLLSDVPERELIDTAFRLLNQNACDFVLANDLSDIRADSHVGYLLSPDRSYVRYNGKPEIAEGIVAAVLGKLGADRRPS